MSTPFHDQSSSPEKETRNRLAARSRRSDAAWPIAAHTLRREKRHAAVEIDCNEQKQNAGDLLRDFCDFLLLRIHAGSPSKWSRASTFPPANVAQRDASYVSTDSDNSLAEGVHPANISQKTAAKLVRIAQPSFSSYGAGWESMGADNKPVRKISLNPWEIY